MFAVCIYCVVCVPHRFKHFLLASVMTVMSGYVVTNLCSSAVTDKSKFLLYTQIMAPYGFHSRPCDVFISAHTPVFSPTQTHNYAPLCLSKKV